MNRRLLGVTVAAASIAAAVLPATAGTRGAPARPGCDTPAVIAHHAGGRALHPQPAHLPRACGNSTGFPGAESHLVIRNDGSVVYTPAVLPSGLLGTGTAPVDQNSQSQSNASPAGLAVTSDHGSHWRVLKPSGVTWNPTDHSDYVDAASGRMFFEDYGPIPLAPSMGPQQEGPAHINWTDDLRHWHHTVISGLTLPENPRFTSGRAPAGNAKPQGGYPSVLYFCANTNVGFVSPVIAGRMCFRSLDGGDTWAQRALLFTGAAPQHAECGGNGEVYSAIDGYYPQAAPDGSLYVMVACGGKTYLARSKDEAATFPVVHGQSGPVTLPVVTPGPGAVGGSPELRITNDGTFLLSYQQGNHLLMRLSTTRGVTWSNAVDLTAPGVTAIKQWTMASSGRGDVAFAYLGHRKGQSTWDGYLTSTRNVLRGFRSPGGPVFLSGQVNPVKRPLLYGNGVQGSGYLEGPGGTPLPYPPPFNQQMFGNDFIGAAVAPDGTPWGSFTQDCGPAYDSAGCRKQHDQTRGYAGYLG
ncbi:MAG: hypothetical protein QOF18_843 [Frankiaceae bacterium]|nr:hypothetical protein [Frankiaceae bacterium]